MGYTNKMRPMGLRSGRRNIRTYIRMSEDLLRSKQVGQKLHDSDVELLREVAEDHDLDSCYLEYWFMEKLANFLQETKGATMFERARLLKK